MKIMGWPAFSNKKINPYNYLLYSAIIAKGYEVTEYRKQDLFKDNFDILHIHWPDGVLKRPYFHCLSRAAWLLLRLKLLRRANKRVVWTVHNVTPHSSCPTAVVRGFYSLLLNSVDGLMYLSENSRNVMNSQFEAAKTLPYVVSRHGTYNVVIPHSVKTSSAVENWIRSERRVLYFGQIRDYKNVPELVKAFKGVNSDRRYNLLVAGQPQSEEIRSELHDLTSGDSAITLELSFLDEGYLNYLVDKADVVVLPFREITNSGSVMLSLSIGTRVISKRNPAFDEINSILSEEVITQYDGELTACKLEGALDTVFLKEAFCVSDVRAQFNWKAIADDTINLYRQLMISKRTTEY